MNIILFERHETAVPLPLTDRRARHVLDVLRFGAGDSFDAGVIDGPRGKATIRGVDAAGLHLGFVWGDEPAALEPISLIIGLPRPQTARKVLEEATALGVAAIHFVVCERGEPGYARSKLWTTDEWRRHLVEGASQAFSTWLPAVHHGETLINAVRALPRGGTSVALDNYEATRRLSEVEIKPPAVLALGPERGWSAAERDCLRASGFVLASLGERVLRVETACAAAVALVRAGLGSM